MNSIRRLFVSFSTVLLCFVTQAAVITVPGDHATIQAAVDAADENDTIKVAAGTYTERIEIYKSLSIEGAGAATTIVDGGGLGTVIFVYGDVEVSFSGLTVQNGKSQSDGGGGIYLQGDTEFCFATIDACVISNNGGTSQPGGGIYCELSSLEISNSTINGNTAPLSGTKRFGGGLYTINSDLYVNNCTFSGNSARYGGGIYFANTDATLTHVTITANSADALASGQGGGVFLFSTLNSVRLENSILADNTAPSAGSENIYDPNGTFSDEGGNFIGTDAGLAALADNGGPTPTHALSEDSPALNLCEGSFLEDYDQRGVYRDQNNAPDAGAYEKVYFAYVDDDFTALECDGYVWGADAFTTIQAAVAAVPAMGYVTVYAGNYSGDLTLDKELELSGDDNPVLDGNVFFETTDLYVSGLILAEGKSWNVTANGSIQEAVDAANDDDTINVAAGTYFESVHVNRPLTLNGANKGIAGTGTRGAESIIDGESGHSLMVADNRVTVDGFTLTGETGIVVNSITGVTIRNNVIIALAAGLDLRDLISEVDAAVSVASNKIVLADQIAGANPTVGISLMGASGTAAVSFTGNTVQDAFYGYLFYGVMTEPVTTVAGGSITGVMQGVAVVNINPLTGTSFAPTAFAVDGTSISAFSGSHPTLPNYNFHAGVYVFTGGSDPAALVSGTLQNVTVNGTGKPQQDSAGLSFSDFSTGAGVRQQITVIGCTLTDNANRGMIVRGDHAVVTATGCTLTNNGHDPFGTDGNDGYGVTASNGAEVTIELSTFTNPASVAGGLPVTALYVFKLAGGADASLTLRDCVLNNNGCPTGKLAARSSGTLDAINNWWGSSFESDVAAATSGGVLYTPWYANAAKSDLVPYNITLSATAVDENVAPGTLVGTIASTDADGGSPVYTLADGGGLTGADNASFAVDGTFLNTLAPLNFETKSSYAICVQVDDGKGGLNWKSFTVTVTDINDAPVATADSGYSVTEGGTLTVATAQGVLANDTDEDRPSQILTAAKKSETQHGTVTLAADGSFIYVHDGGESTTDSFTYQVNDGVGNGNIVTVDITITSVNDAPVLADIADRVSDGLALVTLQASATDEDLPVQVLTYSLVGAETYGASITDDGAFSWQPTEAQDPGVYTFTVRVTDNGTNPNNLSDEQSFSVTVNEDNKTPVANDDEYVVAENGTLNVVTPGVLANDTDADVPENTLSAVLVSGVAHGALTLNADGSFTYVNNGDETASDTFTYKVNDGTADSNVATVTITVTPVNDNPTISVALPDLAVQQDFAAIPIALAPVFADAENDALTYSVLVTGEAVLTASITGTELTLTAISGLRGTATVTVTVTENATAEALHVSDSFTVTVKPVWNTTQNTFFDTIQAAIADSATVAGDEISVAAGIYSGTLTINKGVILRSVAGATTTTLAGAAAGAVKIEANGVEIRGFTISNPAGLYGIYALDRSNLRVAENIIENIATAVAVPGGAVCGIQIYCKNVEVAGVIIQSNLVRNVESKGNKKSANGIWVGDSTGNFDVTGLVVEGNTISNIKASPFDFASNGRGAYGMILNHADASKGHTGRVVAPQILNNTITDLEGVWAHAIGLEGNTPDALVQGNTIARIVDHKSPADPDAVGVMVEANASAATVTITQNSFIDVLLGVRNLTVIPVVADGNYWGVAEPQIDTLLRGAVVVENFYATAELTDLLYWTVYVDGNFTESTEGWGFNCFAKIQDGVNTVARFGSVHVAAGTYLENVTVGKTLNFVGADMATTTINGGGAGVVVMITANDVSMTGFTVTGSGMSGVAGGIGLINVTGCAITGNTMAGNFMGIGVVGGGDNTISGNVLTGNGIGITLENLAAFGGTAEMGSNGNTISGNTVTGSLQHGINIPENCNGNTVANNTVTGSAASGIYLWKAHDSVVEGNIVSGNSVGIEIFASRDGSVESNTITGNGRGIVVRTGVYGALEPATTGLVVIGNNIGDNTLFGLTALDNQGHEVTASANYWGAPTGPSGEGFFGSGTAVAGSVVIASYYTDAARTTLHYYDLYVDTTYNDTTPGWGATAFATIPSAYAAANPGDTIHVADGTYTLGSTFTVAKQGLTLSGASRDGVTIDASTRTSTAYGIAVRASDVTLEHFTLIPASYTGAGFPIHVSNTPNILANITLRDIEISGSYRTPFDFNGVDNLRLEALIASNTVYGTGIGLTGCSNVLIAGCATSGNAWGGVRVSTSPANQANRPCSNVNVDFADNTFAEVNALYIDVDGAGSTVNATGYSYSMVTSAGTTTYLEQGYTEEQVIAIALQTEAAFPGLIVTGLFDLSGTPVPFDGELSTAVVYVDDSWLGTPAGTGVPKPDAPDGTYLQFGRNAFATIATGVAGVDAGGTVNVLAGTYNERVVVSKANLTVQGAGVDSIVTGTTAAPGSGVTPAVFKVTADGVTVKRFKILVDFAFNHSAVHTSGTCTGLTVSDNTIIASATATAFSYGLRNAIAVNPGITVTGYVQNNVGYAGVTVSGNTIQGSEGPVLFRAGVQMDLCAGTITGNTITSVNHDFISRFANQGDITVSDNTFLGGGAQVGSFNPGAGTVTITGNVFDSSVMQSATGALGTGAALRLIYFAEVATVNNAVVVSANTFQNHRWAVSAENFKNVTFDSNTFTPKADSADYVHMSFNTKIVAGTSAAPILNMFAVGATLTKNTFNGSGVAGGTALAFYNHRSTDAVFGTYAVGTLGNENLFNAGISTFIQLDGSAGSSADWTLFGGYGSIPVTTMAPWALSLDLTNNKFDAGTGLQLASVMPLADQLIVEDKISHKVDNATLGLVRVKADNVYVTQASGSIQRGIDAAAEGDQVNLAAGTFNENVEFNKRVTVDGQGSGNDQASNTIVVAAFPNAPVFRVTATGSSVDDRLVIKDLLVTGASPSGNNGSGIYLAAAGSHFTFDNIASVDNGGYGVVINLGGRVVGDLVLTNCNVSDNTGAGFKLASVDSIDGIVITGSHFDRNNFGFFNERGGSASFMRGLRVTDSTFDGNILTTANTGRGFQVEKLTDAIFTRVSFSDNQNHGVLFNLKDGNYADIAFTDCVFNDNIGTGTAGLFMMARNDGTYAVKPASLANVDITGCVATGNSTGISLGNNITDITVAESFLAGNTIAGLNNLTDSGAVLAENNWWGNLTGPANAANPGGTGAIVYGNVDFSPWLADGTDTDDVAIGFQPNMTAVYYSPASLLFTQQPGGAALGQSLVPQPSVTVLDEIGQVATQFVGNVSLSISANPGSGELAGTTNMSATAGVASFSTVAVANDGGEGFKLMATVGALTVVSDSFTIINPDPLLSSIDPIFIAKGSDAFGLTVSGAGFVPSSKVLWNGTPCPTTYVSGMQLIAAIPSADLEIAGTVPISVASPEAAPSGTLAFTITETALAPVVYVDGLWTGPANCGNHVWGYDAFPTIQGAIGDASSGVMNSGTIQLLAGTYNEDPTLFFHTTGTDKQFNILGEVDASGAPLPTLQGSLTITHEGADTGWRIENINFVPDASTTKLISVKGVNNFAIKNCTFDGAGRFLVTPSVNAVNYESSSNGNTSPTIEDCVFGNGLYTAVSGIAVNLTVNNCIIQNVKSGFNSRGENMVIQNTEISVIAPGEGDTYGIRYGSSDAGSANGLTLTRCIISVNKNGQTPASGSYHCAVYIRSGAIGTLKVSNCALGGEMVNLSSAVALDASGNWWGGADAAMVTAKLVAGSVDYSPWLAVGTDTDGGAVGFNGDFATLWVDDDSPNAGTVAHIQEGVNLVTAGGTVNVRAGTYIESNILIDKSLMVRGTGTTRADVVVVPANEDGNVDSAFNTSAQNGFIVRANDVAIKNLTLDGRGNPDLTAGKNNFRIGIVTADASYPGGGGGAWHNLHVDEVHIKFPYRRGISVFPGSISGTVIENSRIDYVAFNHGMYIAGQSQILSNTVNNAFQGIVVAPDVSTPAGLIMINGNELTEIGNYPGCWGYNAGTGEYGGQPRAIQFNNSDSAGRPVEILNNIISDNGMEEYSGAVGIYTRLANSDSLVAGNVISLSSGVSWADPGSQAVGMLLGWSYANGFTVTGNRINSTKYGIGMMVFGNGTAEKPLRIESNELRGTDSAALETGDGTGIYIANQYLFASDKSPTCVNLVSNIIAGYVTAVGVEKTPASDKTLTVTANYNNLSGNTTGISSTGGPGILTDARLNWFGSATGPANGSNPGGTGSAVSGTVGFSPWLGDGTDTDPAIGFQPNLTPVYYLPTGLRYTQQPGNAYLGAAFVAQPQVEVLDEIGNVATQFNGTVTLTIGNNSGVPVQGELRGLATVTVVNGAASFEGLAIGLGTGNGYTLVAVTAGLDPVTSAVFDILNSEPVLTFIGNRTVNEQELLSFTVAATDTAADQEAQTLTFSLTGTVPQGVSFDAASGAFAWTPSEAQGGAEYTFTVVVTDNGTGARYDTEEITITVTEVNVAPVLTLDPAGNSMSVDEQQRLEFTAVATDQDLNPQTLTFSLAAVADHPYPSGATLNESTGAFVWNTTEEQGGITYMVDVIVTDSGTNPDALAATQRVTIAVAEINIAPELALIAPQSVNFGQTLSFTAWATDQDRPSQTLTYTLSNQPAGAAIDPATGLFTWTPTEAQAQMDYSFTVTVTDDGVTPLSHSQPVTVGAVSASQDCAGYRSPSVSMVVSNRLAFGEALTSLVWTPVLPDAGWQLIAADAGGNGVAEAQDGAVVFTTLPTTSPVVFSYTVSVPGNAAVSNTLSATVSFNTLSVPVTAMPIYRYHSADYRRDLSGTYAGQFRKIDSTELNRVLSYWRVGGYRPNPAGSDGYSVQADYAGDVNQGLHSADYINTGAEAWVIDDEEVQRVIAYWAANGYHVDLAGADGNAPDGRTSSSGPRPLAMPAMQSVSQTAIATYNPGETVQVTCIFNPEGVTMLSLGWRPVVPAGWIIESVSGDGNPELVRGAIVCTGTLPTGEARLVYTVRVPLTECGMVTIGGSARMFAQGAVNPETYAMDDLSLTALDADGNGMADAWERLYAGAAGTLDPDGDLDGDHLSNLAEYLCGTVPTDANSVLKMVSISVRSENTTELSWSSVAGRVYTLQRADGTPAADRFTDIAPAISADPSGRNIYVDTVDPQVPHFYRVILK